LRNVLGKDDLVRDEHRVASNGQIDVPDALGIEG
jgi:hypothetical protein